MSRKTAKIAAQDDKVFDSMDAAGEAMLQNPDLKQVNARENGKIVPIVRVQKTDWQREDESYRRPIPSHSLEKVTVAILRAPRLRM